MSLASAEEQCCRLATQEFLTPVCTSHSPTSQHSQVCSLVLVTCARLQPLLLKKRALSASIYFTQSAKSSRTQRRGGATAAASAKTPTIAASMKLNGAR